MQLVYGQKRGSMKGKTRPLISLLQCLQRKYIRIFVSGFFLVVTLIYFAPIDNWRDMQQYRSILPNHTAHIASHEGLKDTSFTQSCVLPKLDLWPTDMTRLLAGKGSKIKCPGTDWVYSKHGRFYITDEAVASHGAIKCVYSELGWSGDFSVKLYKPTHPIENGSLITTDYMFVNCFGADKARYVRFHTGVPLLPEPNLTSSEKAEKKLNVVVITFDSVSRLAWLRALPKTHKYFVQKMGGVVLEGYNIRGAGTPAATCPILLGRKPPELPESRRGFPGGVTVDGYPWIWNDYKRKGYRILYAEDATGIGMWTYRLRGFARKPVDHYMRMFYLAMEGRGGKGLCYGALSTHNLIFRHVQDYLETNAKWPKFAYIHDSELSHGSYVNLRRIDDDFLAFLRSVDFNNTMLILHSDHGDRYTKARNTRQGRLEERLPYFGLFLPPWFRGQHPDYYANLRKNAQRLTTSFDVHETLKHILNVDSYTGLGSKVRGQSLFTDIPDRTCADADIITHYCVCSQGNPVKSDTKVTQDAIQFIMKRINFYTEPLRNICLPLEFSKLVKVNAFSPLILTRNSSLANTSNDTSKETSPGLVYLITINTKPNSALYDITLKFYPKRREFELDDREVNRMNSYGRDAECIRYRRPDLAEFCLCIKR